MAEAARTLVLMGALGVLAEQVAVEMLDSQGLDRLERLILVAAVAVAHVLLAQT